MATLEEFISRIGEAGVEASKACEEQARKRIESLCDIDSDGNLIPKTISIQVGDEMIKVPLLSLIAPTRVDIESLKVRFQTTVQIDNSGKPNISSHIGLLKRGVKVDAEIVFKADDSVEAVELLRDRTNKILSQKLEAAGG